MGMSLSAKDQRLLRLFLACCLGRWDEVRRVRASAGPGEPERTWREAVLQVHLFAGVPRMVEACAVLLACGGLGEPEPGEVEESRAGDLRARGRGLFDRIYTDHADAVRDVLHRGHPEIARWVEEHAYGRVLARPGLSADRRELLAVVALAALGQERQLASHARGAVRCGAAPAEIAQALDVVADLVEPERLEEARRVLSRFTAVS